MKNLLLSGKVSLALSIIFLYSTGLRIGEALDLPLAKFGDNGYIVNFTQSKSTKPRQFVGITKQLQELAAKHNWKGIFVPERTLRRQLKSYGLSPHAFRHAHVSRRAAMVESLEGASAEIGHSSTKITNIYVHVDSAVEKKLTESLYTLNLGVPEEK